MPKKHAALALAFAATAVPAAAAPAYNILCQLPGTQGAQRMEAYESAPGIMEIWYGQHAQIKIFEPLTRGTPIGPDNVIRARIRGLSMDTHYHTVDNRGYATMTRDDFVRVFNTGAPGHTGVLINGWRCAVDIMTTRPRIIPFDPRGFTP